MLQYIWSDFFCFCFWGYCKVSLKGEDVNNGEAEAVVIGGMVLDIHATPSIPANPRTTTPGKVISFSLYMFFNFLLFPMYF
jgi:hypothetical protein